MRCVTGEEFKRIRTTRGMTQVEVAKLANMTPNMITKIEANDRGIENMRAKNVVDLAYALGVPIADLVAVPDDTSNSSSDLVQQIRYLDTDDTATIKYDASEVLDPAPELMEAWGTMLEMLGRSSEDDPYIRPDVTWSTEIWTASPRREDQTQAARHTFLINGVTVVLETKVDDMTGRIYVKLKDGNIPYVIEENENGGWVGVNKEKRYRRPLTCAEEKAFTILCKTQNC